MPLPDLLNVPRTKEQWDAWSFAHRDHHHLIRQAIYLRTNGVDNLFEYQLDPIPTEEVTEWLSRNQQSHDDFNKVLGLEGQDLEGVDFKDFSQLSSWILSHWQEHQNAAVALGI